MKFAIMYRPAGTGETWKALNVIADTEESARQYVIDNYHVIGNENIASALFSATTTEYQNDTTVETVTVCQNENILYLEKRGCDFWKDDKITQLSDVGNYRVVTHGETVPGTDGRRYCFEFTHWERYNYRTTNKRTGKPLMHPVKELVNPNALCIDSEYTDDNGCWRNCTLERELESSIPAFTVAGILETVNKISSIHYDRIIFAPEKAIKAIPKIRKQAGFRELSILDNLESAEVKQADRHYLVFAYYDMDGNGFEYEYNSDRIVG